MFVCAACLSPPAPTRSSTIDGGIEVAPSIIEVQPDQGVPPDALIAILLSEPAMLAVPEFPIAVRRSTGDPVDSNISFGASGYEIDVRPSPTWPMGDTLEIVIAAGLVGRSGLPLVLPNRPISFSTAVQTSSTTGVDPRPAPLQGPSMLVIRAPTPGTQCPMNLATVTVELSPPVEIQQIFLVDSATRIPAVVESSLDGTMLARLPRFAGACAPLCPSTKYRVEVADPSIAIAVDGPRGEVMTSTSSDDAPPSVTATSAVFQSEQLIVTIQADEPVLLRGTVRTSSAVFIPLLFPLLPKASVLGSPVGELPSDSEVTIEVSGEDVAGNALADVVMPFHTPARIEVMISEAVPHPLHDWNHSDGVGVPFDDHPGTGAVTSADQWVELVNLSTFPVDLTAAGIVLRVLDETPTDTELDAAPEYYFGDGGSVTSWWPGEALVLHPKGTMSKRGFVLIVVIGDRELDRVGVGDVSGAVSQTTTPPDMAHEALGRTAVGDWKWCLPTPGDPAPDSQCL
jgi:hypothetical protein